MHVCACTCNSTCVSACTCNSTCVSACTCNHSLYISCTLGSLRPKVQEWLMGCGQKQCSVNCSNMELKFLKSLHDFPSRYCSAHYMVNAFATYDDGDLDAWESEAKRWARVLFLAIKEESHLIPIWTVCPHFCSSSPFFIFIDCSSTSHLILF